MNGLIIALAATMAPESNGPLLALQLTTIPGAQTQPRTRAVQTARPRRPNRLLSMLYSPHFADFFAVLSLRLARWALACGAFVFGSLSAATWHVAGTGNDQNDGTSRATAFRSLQKAAGVVAPGDTVWVGDGLYGDPVSTMESSVVVLSTSGKPDAWITWQAEPGQHPELRPSGWNGILVTASYQVIDGLTVTGSNDSIYLQEALADAKAEKPAGRFNTNGIYVNGRLAAADAKPHHVIIRHCTIGKCGGGGIVAIQSDYVTIEDCKVFENAWFSRYGCSGISTLTNWAFDNVPGYHFLIQRNLVWNNRTIVPWEKIGKLSDGNGIILDVSDPEEASGATNPNADAAIAAPVPTPTPPKVARPLWRGRTLVANNVSAHNGGSGIHTFRAKHADIVNNTTYWNGENVGYAEIFANHSEDIAILNNIIVPRPAGKVTSNNRNTNVRWDYNVYPTGPAALTGPHDLVTDPLFVNMDPIPTRANLRLKPGSPALGSASDDLPQATDVTGRPRPLGLGRDRGAFQQ